MMQAADLRNGNDLAAILNGPYLGRILRQGQMRPRAVITGKVALEHATEMSLRENHHVIQTFATDRSDQPLGIGVLPRIPGLTDDFFSPRAIGRDGETRDRRWSRDHE